MNGSALISEQIQGQPVNSLRDDGLNHSNAAFQYAIAAIIFIVYGVQVCPFLESMKLEAFSLVVACLFTVMYFFRLGMLRLVKISFNRRNLKKYFYLDISVFFFGGFILATCNYLILNFPFGAGFRVAIGTTILGILVSIGLFFEREKHLILTADSCSPINGQSFVSIGRKIHTFVLSLLTFSLIVILLLIYKDFEWLNSIGDDISVKQAALWIFYEVFFVLFVFITYGSLIIYRFSSNIQLLFERQNSVMKDVKKGNLNARVPVTSHDEFSVMAHHTNDMIYSLKQSEENLKVTRDATILAISSLAETRDNETGAHILRTQAYVRSLCSYLSKLESYSEMLSPDNIELIVKSAPLHDIGKVGIPDSILLKPGKLSDEEFEVMKGHALIGVSAIERAEQQLGEIPFLTYAKEISATHHEKWDGSGYPVGLSKTDIPLSGRLMALADVYDALISKRVYKPAFSHEKSKSIILEGRGKHFDPDIVDAFIAVEHEFISIADNFKDEQALLNS